MTPATRNEAVETIRQRIDIVEVVGRYVKLKKVGSNFVGLCPFHGEKAPSFTVSTRKGFFHCFGCKASGDVFSFLMKIEGRDFPEVLEELADRAGVELPKLRPSALRAREEGQRQIEINEVAAAFYEQRLWEGSGGAGARRYLEGRGLEPDTIRRFRIGYAPEGWQGLSDHLQRKKLSLQDACSLGLLGKGSRGFYDIFRNRMVFPILGLDGKVRGFGARVLDPKEEGPKYINSRQSQVFDKSEILYGMAQARAAIQSSGLAVLVEGYFDVITPVAAGIEQVVATCGTAFTENHSAILRRFAEKVVAVFDADEAGLAASFRSARVLLQQDLSPYMVELPAGEDPDSFVRNRGGEAFRQLIESAKPTLEVLAESGLRAAGGDVEARTRALKKMVGLLAACRDSLRLGAYVHLLADRFSVGEDFIQKAVLDFRRREGDRSRGGTTQEVRSTEKAPPPPEEEALVVLLELHPRLREKVDEADILGKLSAEPLRELVRQMIDAGSENAERSSFIGIEDEEMRDRLIGISVDGDAYPDDKADSMLADCILKIRRRYIKVQQRRLTEGISRAEAQGDLKEVQRLVKDKIRLERELKTLEVPVGAPS